MPTRPAPVVLSIVVPVFNEARHLSDVLDMLMTSPSHVEREWIFVDDCSTDGSASILRQHQPKYGYKLVEFEKNQGKGSAVIRGISEASGQLIMIQDADFEYDPRDVPSLLEPLLECRADVVFGSRFKKSSFQVHRTYHYFVNRYLTLLSNLFSGVYLTDMETCYKVFKADLLKAMSLRSRRFGIEVELTAYVGKTSARIYELPIHYYPRTNLQGKKINWKDGFAALWHLVRFNFLTQPKSAFVKGIPALYDPANKRPISQRPLSLAEQKAKPTNLRPTL